MAVENFQRSPSPNSKYPFVGPNYLAHGEVNGYVYFPWKDQYYIDPKSVEKYNQNTGMSEKEPSAFDQILPVAGTVAAGEIAKGLATGLFSSGGASTATTAVPTVASAVAPTAVAGSTVAPTAATGMLGTSLGALPLAGIAAGIGLGVKGARDLFRGKETKGVEGWGGRATLGIATGGLSELARPFFGQPKTRVEDKKLQDLKNKGLVPENFEIKDESRSREQQLIDARKSGNMAGINQNWLKTGDEKYLTAQDIQGYAGLIEQEADPTKRMQLAQKYVDEYQKGNKLFDEHHGTIDFKPFQNATTNKTLFGMITPKTPLTKEQVAFQKKKEEETVKAQTKLLGMLGKN